MTSGAIILIAIGGALAIEGAAWAVFPAGMRRAYELAFSENDKTLHVTGLVSVALGVAMIAWAVRGAGG
ncbi:MAG: DUF2065 domain-containing protein [Maricaulaceae bacterium]